MTALFVDDTNILMEAANGDILNQNTSRVMEVARIWFDANE